MEDVQYVVALMQQHTGHPSSRSSILAHMPDALVGEPQNATLLGSPLGDVESTSLSIHDPLAGHGEEVE